VRSLLESASHPTGVIGTIEYNDGLASRVASLTTPDPKTLAKTLAAMRARYTSHAAVELSSHALKQHRTAGLTIDVGIVTNITHDHLDYHSDIADYIQSKSLIVRHLKPGGLLVLNADDPRRKELLERIDVDVRVMTFGIDTPADVCADQVNISADGSRFRLTYGPHYADCFLPLIGKHNVSNALAASCAAMHFGLSLDEISDGLEECGVVPGRMEVVDRGQPFQVYVDYAHTDDALRRVISAVRSVTRGRVIVVFGAGGDRDPAKRPLMAQAAALADHVILTSDNPRSEDPHRIIEDILAGFQGTAHEPTVHVHRRQAIAAAIRTARPGDAVIVAGKGHEKYQLLGDRKLPFDDVLVCRELLTAASRGEYVGPQMAGAI
jgi:UDP-N-acetylmuramoyl-L-alanyl-D-glutamate--2,6-diaminopimelate ligase